VSPLAAERHEKAKRTPEDVASRLAISSERDNPAAAAGALDSHDHVLMDTQMR